MYYINFDFGTCEEEYVFDYYLFGTDVVNGQTYNVVFSTPMALLNHTTGAMNCSPMPTFTYGIREDGNKKVFLYNYSTATEHLLYDFSLNVGDTLFNSLLVHFPTCPTDYEIVTAIDSVMTGSVYRTRWHFTCIAPVVEGFGSGNNPFGSVFDPYFVGCVKLNPGSEYNGGYLFQYLDSNDANQYCNYPISVPDIYDLSNRFLISYDNSQSEIIIKNDESNFKRDELFEVQLIDLYGRIVVNEKIKLQDVTEISINPLIRGYHIIQLINSKGVTSSKPFLIY
jgi:hypothetical protein